MSLFNRFGRRKKKGKSSAPRREPRLMSIDGESYTEIKTETPVIKKKKKLKGKKGGGRRWYWVLIRKLFLPVMGLFALFALWIWYDLPDISMIGDIKKTPGITIKADDGSIIGSDGDVYGDFVPYSQLPQHLIDAAVATEDRNFFRHFGVDPMGLARAVFVNLTKRRLAQGGSTITQQLAKNAFLTPDRTLKRKIQEMILAFQLEKRFSKKDILAMYLNRVFMGANCYGVDAASKRYFGHPIQEATLNESAMLVGLLKAPTRYAPTTNPDKSEKRATQVLLNMMDAGYLTQKQVDEGRKSFDDEDAAYRDNPGFGGYYFKDYVTGQIVEMLGQIDKDIIVTTTLQPDRQHDAEAALNGILAKKGAELKASQGALVSMSPDGAIRAMVGGRSYRGSQFNRATQALRQPGSSFKLFVFLAALEAGYTPESMMEDKPITIGKWSPRDYAGKYQGEMNLRTALAESINTIAVQLSEAVGRNRVISMAERLGITEDIDANPSLALGTTEVTLLEMTRAYAHLASGGNYVRPYAIRKIETTDGRTLYEHKDDDNGRALTSDTVAMMNNMLLSVTANGTGRGALIGRPVAGKTGTASDYRDAWFVGFVPQLVTGVWVGNDDTSPMKKVTGGNLPATIFKTYMMAALKGVPVADIPSQSGPSGGSILPWLSSTPSQTIQPPPPAGTQLPTANKEQEPEQQVEPNNPFAVIDNEEAAGQEEEPSTEYNVPQSFWDKLLSDEKN